MKVTPLHQTPRLVLKRRLIALAVMAACTSVSGSLFAADGQYYLGLSAGASQVEPETGDTGYSIDENLDGAFTVFAGYDLTDYLSLEGFYASYGSATLSGPTNFDTSGGVSGIGNDAQFLGEEAAITTGTVAYNVLGAAGVIQFPDNNAGLSGIVKLGMSMITSETSGLGFNQADETTFSAGLGAEYQLKNGVAFRGMYDYINEHVQGFNVSVLKRFGKVKVTVPEPDVAAEQAKAKAQAAAQKVAQQKAQQQAAAKAKQAAAVKAAAAAKAQAAASAKAAAFAAQRQAQARVVQPPVISQTMMAAPVVMVQQPAYDGPSFTDADLDGVSDGIDICKDTRLGSSVDERGCPAGGYAAEASTYGTAAPAGSVLEGVSFLSGSAKLTAAGMRALQSLAPTIASGYTRIALVGHTDSRGDAQKNFQLSEQRAKTVAEYLASLGISADRLKFGGKGQEVPLASNDTAEGRAKNRRVEMFLE